MSTCFDWYRIRTGVACKHVVISVDSNLQSDEEYFASLPCVTDIEEKVPFCLGFGGAACCGPLLCVVVDLMGVAMRLCLCLLKVTAKLVTISSPPDRAA